MMRKNETILNNREKSQNMQTKWSKLIKFLFPNEMQVIQFISEAVIDPGIVILFVNYVWGETLNIPLTYLVMEVIIFSWWIWRSFRYKRRMEMMSEDRMEQIEQKLEELRQLEQELKQKNGQNTSK